MSKTKSQVIFQPNRLLELLGTCSASADFTFGLFDTLERGEPARGQYIATSLKFIKFSPKLKVNN